VRIGWDACLGTRRDGAATEVRYLLRAASSAS
jgi:hypothetical protein